MLNKVMLIGNVGRDPEIRHLDTGVATTTIALATSETYIDKTTGQRVTNTEWHSVVLWRQWADMAERYIRKGTQLYVEGRIRTRTWDDRDGQRRSTTEIIADTVRLLSRREDNSNAGAQPVASASPAGYSHHAAPAHHAAAPAGMPNGNSNNGMMY
ncbi:MAG: single-stranded DNA-binding protein [Prevotellaceae bacterium]|jgi:single-strand DNA-binding protein|nr:single-stranded DNA-binding protein [Prevotellaceae bacterium]